MKNKIGIRKGIITILSLLFLLACDRKNEIEDSLPMNAGYVIQYNDKEKINALCEKVLTKGDTLAFNELERIYFISEHSDELLYFSTVMSEKYNYARAFETNYRILYSHKDSVSNRRRLAIYNLLKLHESGKSNKSFKEKIEKTFPNGVPTSADFWKLK
jgi:hypothetical protein